ncbi:MAG TPA: hydantoinase/oxoprolinase family protein, partial [Acetobacteraceae bacterium]|nr:hydantoinase/oxoprolinase family protein [Acetobacteraceae bacterium]
IGWDVGGAHLKAARIEGGRAVAALQLPCPLWQGLELLPAAIRTALDRLGPADRHAATMTGELADVFASRAEGVAHIARVLADTVAPAEPLIWAGRAGFIAPRDAPGHAADVASANWLATATLAAQAVPAGLLADMGSTTTDLVPFAGGAPRPAGRTDAERMACGELVYTGLVRSFVFALADLVPFAGAWTPLACEYFATSADIYRLLGELPEEADQMPTADGREKTEAASRARLARMVGRDEAEAPAQAWRDLAAWLAEAQLRRIADAAMLVLSRTALPPDAPVIGAGCGRHVTRRLAERLGRPWRDFAGLEPLAGLAPAVADQCAPAVAVALLAAGERQPR